jgi:hypothetical protein
VTAAARPERGGREWTLPAGAGLVALETTILISVIAFGSYRAGPALVGFLCLKYVFCWGLVRRRPGAWMALLLFEGTTAVVALAKPGLPIYERALEEILALGCIVLLAAAATVFPSPKLPST